MLAESMDLLKLRYFHPGLEESLSNATFPTGKMYQALMLDQQLQEVDGIGGYSKWVWNRWLPL